MIRIGFVGCGGIALEYLARLDELGERVRVTAFCDLELAKAEELAAGRGARAFQNYEDLYKCPDLEAVFVCLPPFARGDELVKAAEHGLHVFTTKPLALDSGTAERSAVALKGAGVLASVGYMFRYSGITERAKELLGERRPALVLGRVIGAMPSGWVAQGQLSGGQILEQSTHIVDVARYLAGDVTRVSAEASSGHVPDRVDYPDTTVLSLRFSSGAVGSLVSSAAVWNFYWALTLVARDLHLELVYDVFTLKGVVDGQVIDEHDPRSGYPEQVEAFVRAVETGDASLIRSPYEDALHTFQTTLAANRALKTGRPQTLAEPSL